MVHPLNRNSSNAHCQQVANAPGCKTYLVENEVQPRNECVVSSLELDKLGRVLRNKLRILKRNFELGCLTTVIGGLTYHDR